MDTEFHLLPLAQVLAALLFAPLLAGIIMRTKAAVAGRCGQPLLQEYFDLFKLLRKEMIFSRTTTWVFRAGPAAGLAAVAGTLLLVPWGRNPAPVSFPGDLVLFASLLGLARFVTIMAALDTGSGFGGMGASREATFAAVAEVALFLSLAALARATGKLSLSDIFRASCDELSWTAAAVVFLLVAAAFLVVFLTENARMPVDEPGTHLELTMVHEAMLLDHSGPCLAMAHYGAAIKLWVVGSLLVGVLFPFSTGVAWMDALCFVPLLGLLAVVTGLIESAMARLRLLRVPQLLVAAGAFSVLALLLIVK